MRTVHAALVSLGVDALVSIGGDDTLKTANKFKLFQEYLPADAKRIPVVHLPKTIDNDYCGIDFTFGYFTAVETLASEIRNLLADAEATRSYYLAETMGRSAGWLAYGAAIAGEASLVISVEDITASIATRNRTDPTTGETEMRPVMKVEEVVKPHRRPRCASARKKKEGIRRDRDRRRAGRIPAAAVPGRHSARRSRAHRDLASQLVPHVRQADRRTNTRSRPARRRKINGLQLGYEARCARPHAFDVMLGSQLGVGAYRALVEEKLNGVMVSVHGQLELNYVPFETLIDPETLVTMVRFVEPTSRFPPPGPVPGNLRQRVSAQLRQRHQSVLSTAIPACPWCWARPVCAGPASTAIAQRTGRRL